MLEEGAMLHVPNIVEELPDGTTLLLENFDESTFEVVQQKEGRDAHPSTIVTIGSESRRILGNHVAVYPERLMTYFIKGATDKGDIVLDPFSGTGTTAVIAKALERQYIGFDISEEYVQFSRDRVKAGPYLEPSFLHEEE